MLIVFWSDQGPKTEQLARVLGSILLLNEETPSSESTSNATMDGIRIILPIETCTAQSYSKVFAAKTGSLFDKDGGLCYQVDTRLITLCLSEYTKFKFIAMILSYCKSIICGRSCPNKAGRIHHTRKAKRGSACARATPNGFFTYLFCVPNGLSSSIDSPNLNVIHRVDRIVFFDGNQFHDKSPLRRQVSKLVSWIIFGIIAMLIANQCK